MLTVVEIIDKEELVEKFAKEMARLQKKADKYCYVDKNREMTDYVMAKIDELKEFSSKLGICEEMYKDAYTIYDFRKAGRKDYMTEERLLELKRWYDTPTEDF